MTRPPMLMHIRIENDEHNFGLWLPLFLLLPLALVVLIILSPLIFIAYLVLDPEWVGWGMRVLWGAFESFCAMRGLEVDVRNGNKMVYVSMV